MNRIHGYHIGLFVQEMDKANGDIMAQARAAAKFLEHAREMEQAIFDHLQREGEFGGKTSA